MTGFGRSEQRSDQFLIKVEVKTLNSKFLDFSPRLPKELTDKESEIRSMIADSLKRGKVMLTLELEVQGDHTDNIQVDEKLFRAYYQKFSTLSESVGASKDGLVQLALESPQVIKPLEINPEEVKWEDVKNALMDTLHQCVGYRKEEGGALIKKLQEYITNIRVGLDQVAAADANRVERVRSKIQKSMDEIKDKVTVDQNRFEQELIFYLERFDISEEKVRLKQHLDFFDQVIDSEEEAGKKLGFIGQEIGREINTIGSKANDADMQRTVVEMKDNLEKIKEQVLNLM